jgi:hypothetical protein
MTTAYTTLQALPPALAEMVKARPKHEHDELAQETALAYFEAVADAVDVKLEQVFARARSRCRSFARAPVSVRAVSIDDAIGIADLDDDADDDDRSVPRTWRKKDVVRWLAESRGVSVRRAEQQVRAALRKAQEPQQQMSLWGV